MIRHDTTHGWRWIAIASAAGFATSAVLAMGLALERRAFVAGWTLVALLVWTAYARSRRVSLRVQMGRRWIAGLVVGAAAGAWLAFTVLRQPASAAPTGLALAVDLLWLGVVYGAVDALVLSVLPVLALYGARPAESLAAPAARLRWAGVALAGSALVAAAYHAGFREFRGPELVGPLIGNLVITATYLLSGSALAPVLAHVVMHVAAVQHGAATTAQLPPHS